METTISPAMLETERLQLRMLTPEIMTEVFTTYSDEAIMDFLGVTADELEIEKDRYDKGLTNYRTTFRSFLLVEKATGKVIGKCGFHTWRPEHSRGEIGYHMANEEVKGKGYMTEALKAMIAYGFAHMGLNRIEAFVGPNNVPSLKLVRGLGFTEEGRLREHYCKNGHVEDSVCFGLLKREYEENKLKHA
jgi:ribosomal-protein-alanine N-acetyltransferase